MRLYICRPTLSSKRQWNLAISRYAGCLPFTKNFRKFRWKFPSGEKRVPFNSDPFATQWLRFYAPKFKNVAVNSLEVVTPFKSCKWNTHFHRKVSNGKTGLPFQKFRLFRKFSSRTNQKRVFHLHPDRNFRNFLVNGKRPQFTAKNALKCVPHVQHDYFSSFKDGAYYCHYAHVLRISRYSGFLSVMLTNTGIFLRSLKLLGESRS